MVAFLPSKVSTPTAGTDRYPDGEVTTYEYEPFAAKNDSVGPAVVREDQDGPESATVQFTPALRPLS